MEDAEYCINCHTVVEPQFYNRGTTPHSYGICVECGSYICSNHIGFQMTTDYIKFDIHQNLDGWENKNGREYYDTSEQVYKDVGYEVDDEEPYSRAEGHCNQCKKTTTFKIPFYDTGIVKRCNRCTTYYQKYLPKGCQYHKGVHELPLDAKNNVVYQNNLQDIGGMMHAYHATPRMYPGRWSCCGSLCYHDHPGCPTYKTREKDSWQFQASNLVPRIEQDSDYLGCDDCDHDSESYFYATEKLPTHKPIYMSMANGTETPWRNVATWNMGKPHHYPSGDCPESVLEMDQDYWA